MVQLGPYLLVDWVRDPKNWIGHRWVFRLKIKLLMVKLYPLTIEMIF